MPLSKKIDVVVVDDSESIRSYLDRKLTNAGYQVTIFESAIEALQALTQIKPDIIVSDVVMPVMDGFEFCETIKQIPELAQIPLLFLSGEGKPENKLRGFEVGAVDYVTKPIIPEVLIARIETHVKLYHFQQIQVNRNKELENVVADKIDQLFRSQIGTITALAKLAEYRDEDTGTHLERVELYCDLLARDLAQLPEFRKTINNWYIKLIRYASSLHDIGKVAIPDNILLKPGKLTAEEFEIMKNHSKFGSDTLKEVLEKDPDNDFIKMGYEIAHSHHEKWDGSGYPEGLSGDAIPLAARIMAVADVYDALRSERCYKKGFSHSKAYAIIDEGSGNHFDPRIVESFIKNEQQFDEIWQKFQD